MAAKIKKVSKADQQAIKHILDRAEDRHHVARDPAARAVFLADFISAHASHPMRLDDLLKADDFNFSHDVIGIREHYDRKREEFLHGFRPRFLQRKAVANGSN